MVSTPNPDVANAIAEFSSRLRITNVEIPADRCDQPAALLNAGLAAAGGEQIAYLPAGDIYYPYHIELLASVLSNSGMDAAYTSWTLVESAGDRESRGVMNLSQLAPDRLVLGDRAPLPCWMHSRSCTLGALFDESFRTFTGWQFLLHLSQHARVQYIPRMTWEHRLDQRRRQLHSQRMEEARRVMEAFPVTGTLQYEERVRFLDAVENGNWEKSAFVPPLPHAHLTEAKPARKSTMSSWMRGANAPPGLGHRILRGIYRAVMPLHVRHQDGSESTRTARLSADLPRQLSKTSGNTRRTSEGHSRNPAACRSHRGARYRSVQHHCMGPSRTTPSSFCTRTSLPWPSRLLGGRATEACRSN